MAPDTIGKQQTHLPRMRTARSTVIHQESPNEYRVLQTIETPQASRNVGLDATNHLIFVASGKFPLPAGGMGRPQVVRGSFAVLVIEQ